MPCVGVICPFKKKNVSLLECSFCEGCTSHGAPNNEFPLLLRKKYLFPQFRGGYGNGDISVTKIVGCLRKHYLEITSEYYIPIESFKALNFGTAIHDHLEGGDIWHLKENRMQWTTPKGNIIIGYFDIININDRVLYDIKTTGTGIFKQGKDAKPNEHDVLQVTIYATMLKKLSNIELKGIRITYVGLGDKLCNEFEIPYVDRTDFINNQTDFLQSALDRRQIPKGEPLAAWECGYCPFRENCPDKISKVEEKLLKAKLAEDHPSEV